MRHTANRQGSIQQTGIHSCYLSHFNFHAPYPTAFPLSGSLKAFIVCSLKAFILIHMSKAFLLTHMFSKGICCMFSKNTHCMFIYGLAEPRAFPPGRSSQCCGCWDGVFLGFQGSLDAWNACALFVALVLASPMCVWCWSALRVNGVLASPTLICSFSQPCVLCAVLASPVCVCVCVLHKSLPTYYICWLWPALHVYVWCWPTLFSVCGQSVNCSNKLGDEAGQQLLSNLLCL
jgi:hypothetical protein